MSYSRNETNYQHGTTTEQYFKEVVEGYLYTLPHVEQGSVKIYDATQKENMFDHIDFHIHYTSKNIGPAVTTVDVKSPRGGKFYIEAKNVNGELGSLYGKAAILAIYNEVEDVFYMVDREMLAKFVTNNMNLFNWCTRSAQGKRDLFAQVPFYQLKPFIQCEIKGESTNE